MDTKRLLTATRSARKSLDLEAPVDLAEITDCLRIGMQAANGSNQQSWRWLVIVDPDLRARIAELYRKAYLDKVGGQLIAGFLPGGSPEARLMSSTEWLVEHLASVPALVIPCYDPVYPRQESDESFYVATLYGSIFPAVWNFQLARLEDRTAISECMMRYARGMDRRDRDLLRSAYHDGAIDDHVGFVGEVDDFIDWAFAYHATQTRYQHHLLNHTADVDDDSAHAETYYLFVGTDREPANHMTLSGGRYVDRLERRNGRWAIVARACVVEWITESTSSITEEVIGMLSEVQRPMKDRTDPSYSRPLGVTVPTSP